MDPSQAKPFGIILGGNKIGQKRVLNVVQITKGISGINLISFIGLSREY
jgi:hypothetical protein